jgi:amino acid transporter
MSSAASSSASKSGKVSAQVAPRVFDWKSAFSLAFAFISPIVALYGIFFLVFMAAGPASIWAFAIVLVAQIFVAAVFGQLASKWPFSGGVYAWTKRLLGATTGWFAGWAYMWTLMIAIGSAAYIAMLFVPVVLGIEPFDPLSQVLWASVFVLVGTLLNLLGTKVLKAVAIVAVIIEVIGSIGLGAYLLMFKQVQPISVIFESFGSGYGDGPWIWSGLLAAVAFVGWAFVGFESAGDIAEEVKDPERAVPKAMILSILIVGSVVLFSALAVILAMPSIEAGVTGESADPVADTIIYHLGAEAVVPLFGMFVLAFMATFVTAQAAASRVIWGFAKDNMLPGSAALSKLSTKSKIPANAIVVTAVVPVLVILTSLWGAGYSTLVLFAIAGFYISFAFPVLGLVKSQYNGTWKPGVFNLGKWSKPVTLVAAIWLLFELVNISWPRDTSAAWYVQYGVIIIVVVIALVGALIYSSRKDVIKSSNS